MTTTDAVAASRYAGKRSRDHAPTTLRAWYAPSGGLLCAMLASAWLAGCSGTNLLGPSDSPTQAAGPAVLPTQQPQPVSRSRVAIAPIMGAPDALSKQVATQITSALERQRVTVAQAADQP